MISVVSADLAAATGKKESERMSDDSFFREVDEELRHDKVKAVWTRFGTWLLVGAVVVVVGTAATVGYEHYRTTTANAAGDRYAAAVKLADDGQSEAAVTALEAVAADGVGAYPALARLSIGGIEAKAGRAPQAVAAYDAVANDAGAPQGLRDMAALRAAYVLVDSGSLDDVRQRVERLSGDSDPLRFPAREAIALAAWKAGDASTAKPLLEQLVADSGTPRDISGRARILLDLINSGATGPNALPPAADSGAAAAPTAPAAGADNGLGTVDLEGLLGGTGGPAAGEGAASEGAAPQPGDAVMPTTGLGVSEGGASDAPEAAAPTDSAPSGSETTAPATPVPGVVGGAAGEAAPEAGATPGAGAPEANAPTTDTPTSGQQDTNAAGTAPDAAGAPAEDAAPGQPQPPAQDDTTAPAQPAGN
ncbi:hypothetical protein ATO4_24741 [Aurantimonas sp. 22II-16-19i]|nr:hypothetical protein ATO4_24741 [Aurantimonas sp. 22II-16-19i]